MSFSFCAIAITFWYAGIGPGVLALVAREMEIVRIKGALQRAEELSDDVARRYRTGVLK
jgi:hypothetical protein